MHAASVVVTTQSTRFDNLCQTLRFLRDGDKAVDLEVVVVCQDSMPEAVPEGLADKVVELGLPSFSKPVMVNRGVAATNRDLLVLLDGDRVNRRFYLTDVFDFVLGENEVIAPSIIRNLHATLKDAEIERGRSDGRSLPGAWEARRRVPGFFSKTHFSGNAVLRRSDYDLAGGMDESYSGYGFSDNDFGMSCLAAGLSLEFSGSGDLHLWHPRECGGDAFWDQNLFNALKFCRKWGVWPEPWEVPEQIRPRFQAAR